MAMTGIGKNEGGGRDRTAFTKTTQSRRHPDREKKLTYGGTGTKMSGRESSKRSIREHQPRGVVNIDKIRRFYVTKSTQTDAPGEVSLLKETEGGSWQRKVE